MKFLIDENITPDVVPIFKDCGLAAYHINELKSHKDQRVVDDQLRRLSIQKGYIIVTKDDDFVGSFVNRKVPDKVVFLYGMQSKELVLERIRELVPRLKKWIEDHDFIEITETTVRFPFE